MTLSTSWLDRSGHRQWLRNQAEALFDYFATRAINPKGGFFELTPEGKPLPNANPVRGIHGTARMGPIALLLAVFWDGRDRTRSSTTAMQ